MNLISNTNKKIYFASDFHLGTPTPESSKAREQRLLRWLSMIKKDAEKLFLVGDIFDFWFEYKTVVPKGFIRFLGKLAELKDQGIDIQFFVGNHDLWMRDYFTEELGIPVHHNPLQIELYGKKFFIAHGDALGPGDKPYKLLKKIFTNRFCQWLFRWIHPDIGMRIANLSSKKSRGKKYGIEHFLGAKEEWLYQYVKRKMQELPEVDFFTFGHRHLPLNLMMDDQKTRYINLGEWFESSSYAVLDQNGQLELRYFENEEMPKQGIKIVVDNVLTDYTTNL